MVTNDGQANVDWTEADVSGISEADFPILCDECEYQLAGLGERGRCPECGEPFDRRELLWRTYGPEAFAAPAIVEVEGKAAPADQRFVVSVFAAIACAASLPAVIMVGRGLSGRIDFLSCLIAWLLLVCCVEWILAVRAKAREEEEEERAGDLRKGGRMRDEG